MIPTAEINSISKDHKEFTKILGRRKVPSRSITLIELQSSMFEIKNTRFK